MKISEMIRQALDKKGFKSQVIEGPRDQSELLRVTINKDISPKIKR
jgi:hypothetical protein